MDVCTLHFKKLLSAQNGQNFCYGFVAFMHRALYHRVIY